jgi:hypothetical protein
VASLLLLELRGWLGLLLLLRLRLLHGARAVLAPRWQGGYLELGSSTAGTLSAAAAAVRLAAAV